MAAANKVNQYLNFTGEVAKEGRPIPCLDVQLWAGEPNPDGEWFSGGNSERERTPGRTEENFKGKVVLYKLYSKPMKNPMTILKRSAQQENLKVNTMSAEVL